MRVRTFGLALLATLPAPSCAQSGDVQEAVRSALNWYYRWMEPLPRQLASIECSAALFAEESFAFCEPFALSMNIETRENRSPRVIYMGPEPSSFNVALVP